MSLRVDTLHASMQTNSHDSSSLPNREGAQNEEDRNDEKERQKKKEERDKESKDEVAILDTNYPGM